MVLLTIQHITITSILHAGTSSKYFTIMHFVSRSNFGEFSESPWEKMYSLFFGGQSMEVSKHTYQSNFSPTRQIEFIHEIYILNCKEIIVEQ